ncbi:MAG: glycosyltransferase family 1 protein [Acidobacteriota bacterium]
MSIALDATYSLGRNLSGVGVYSRKILFGLALTYPNEQFYFHYRPHRLLPSWGESLPSNAHRRLLSGAPRADLFHALNQRVDAPGKRVVSTFHDLFVMTGDYSTPEFRQRFTVQAREAAQRSDLIIAVSRFTAGQVEALLHVEPSRIRVIPHGVDPAAASTAAREQIVLSVGAIQRRKNTARLVQAFEALPAGWKLILAGAADGFGAAEALAAVDASSRASDIEVRGYVSDQELESLYTRAAIFAFPSLDEGFGMPVLDAMARGVPVVTANRSAMPEVAGGAAVLVDPESVEAIAHALRSLAIDEASRENLAQRGRARALQFPWDAAVRNTWRVYEELRG